MGSLKPDTTYIYERNGSTVYAREFGADPKDRFVIGYDYDNDYIRSTTEKYFLEVEWADILKESRSNPVLQEAIDRVKILYHLSKKDESRQS